MEFLRADHHHLDSCWITWNHPDTKLKVTTYPMVHVGDPGFYDRVNLDLSRCRFILHEGVTWRRGTRKHPLYDLCARNLNIACQETSMRLPSQAEKVNLDMSGGEFRRSLFRLPLRHIVRIVFLRWILWVITLPKSLRPQCLRACFLRKSRASRDEDRPLRELILTARDKRIVENLERFHHTRGDATERAFAGILFGAAHMPAICAGLRHLGYSPGTRRWVEIFRMPSKVRP